MANDVADVWVGITGAVTRGVTAAPTDATSTLTGGTALGLVSSDGVTESREVSTSKINAWQNATLVREVVTESAYKLKFKLIETTKPVIELFHQATVDTATGKVIINPAARVDPEPFVLDVLDGSKAVRIYVPKGQLSEVGDTVYKNDEEIGYEVTINGYYDDTIGGCAAKFISTLKTA